MSVTFAMFPLFALPSGGVVNRPLGKEWVNLETTVPLIVAVVVISLIVMGSMRGL